MVAEVSASVLVASVLAVWPPLDGSYRPGPDLTAGRAVLQRRASDPHYRPCGVGEGGVGEGGVGEGGAGALFSRAARSEYFINESCCWSRG
jgi:hypothetical protein